jgi:tRNA 2-thiouridine synthesizing protein D
MSDKIKLTFAIMDPPYESERSTTFFRLLSIAAKRGYDINVFAYEGGVNLAFDKQTPHGNATHGHNVQEENHPLPKVWVREIIAEATRNGGHVEWVNCGLCVDERGANEAVENTKRGGPVDFWRLASESTNTLTIGTRS